MKKAHIRQLLQITLMVLSSLSAGAVAAAEGTISYTFKTDIREVSSGTGTADDFVTIEINQPVGPIECRSNILKVGPDRRLQARVEALATSALVHQDQVIITIPISEGDCIDGNPEILDIYLLHTR